MAKLEWNLIRQSASPDINYIKGSVVRSYKGPTVSDCLVKLEIQHLQILFID